MLWRGDERTSLNRFANKTNEKRLKRKRWTNLYKGIERFVTSLNLLENRDVNVVFVSMDFLQRPFEENVDRPAEKKRKK